MTGRLRYRDDSGAYAILYGLLLMVVLGVAAIVVDLGAMRQGRRETRLAADAAATAGARELDLLGGAANPRTACEESWSYLATNLGFDVGTATTGCGAFPDTTFSSATCPGTVTTATGTVGDFTVVVTWPVPDTSTLLTEPDVRPAAGNTTQSVDPAVDGTEPCARLGVTVQQVKEPAFASIFGADETSTVVTSVARSTNTPGVGGPIASLNVLEPKDCQAILTDGQGSVEVVNNGDRPGIVAVESSGRHNGAACPNNIPWVIDIATAAAGGHMWANGPGATGTGQGTILSYALNTAPTGNPAQAFNPLTVPPGATLLQPKPTLMAQRFGATPVTDVYDCKGGCPYPHTQYVTNLVSALGGGAVPVPYSRAVAPYNTQTFITLGNGAGPVGTTWSGCTVGVNDVVYVPAGNWYVDCPTLTVRGVLVFAGGTVVTRGGINVAAGCFAMNVPLVGAASCPTLNALGQVVPAATKEGILYLRGGDFAKGSQASLFTERTFVYMRSGKVDFGGGSGALYLTNPFPDPAGCDKECQDARFGKIALWNDQSSDTQVLRGQSGVTLRGVLFTPKATFSYSGQGAQVQTSAQFWANKLAISGQGLLKMSPDPTHNIERPELSTALIR